MRRYDAPPARGIYHNHRPGAYGIFMHKGQILLTYQAGIHHEWQLPGGGVEKGENFPQALAREAYEETGWKVSVDRKITIYRKFVYMPEYDKYAEKICHIYLGRALWRIGDALEVDHSDALMSPKTAAKFVKCPAQHEIIKGLRSLKT